MDTVNHPEHYTGGAVECIEAIKAATAGLTGIEAVCTGNAIKYLWRWQRKGGAEDLRKAKWYIDYLLHALKAARPRYKTDCVLGRCDICGSERTYPAAKSDGVRCADCGGHMSMVGWAEPAVRER